MLVPSHRHTVWRRVPHCVPVSHDGPGQTGLQGRARGHAASTGPALTRFPGAEQQPRRGDKAGHVRTAPEQRSARSSRSPRKVKSTVYKYRVPTTSQPFL